MFSHQQLQGLGWSGAQGSGFIGLCWILTRCSKPLPPPPRSPSMARPLARPCLFLVVDLNTPHRISVYDTSQHHTPCYCLHAVCPATAMCLTPPCYCLHAACPVTAMCLTPPCYCPSGRLTWAKACSRSGGSAPLVDIRRWVLGGGKVRGVSTAGGHKEVGAGGGQGQGDQHRWWT